MVVTALAGALGFLSRVPVGRSEAHWKAFAATPVAFPLAGYVLGVLLAVVVGVAVALPIPAPTVALAYLLALAVVIGVNHFDGVADLGDAAVVHGDVERRRDVLKDTDLGVGGALALAGVVVALALAGLGLAGLPPRAAVGLVVASEVGAKLAMALLSCLGTAAHEGMGSQFTGQSNPSNAVVPLVASAPAVALTIPSPAALVAVLAAVGTGLAVRRWARDNLGGTSGDVFGAADQLARLAALHAGVIAWTLS
ncbi:MAG: adenosylcobinamide-GDP ribazoletransferase [Haloarculaceae archaeon]